MAQIPCTKCVLAFVLAKCVCVPTVLQFCIHIKCLFEADSQPPFMHLPIAYSTAKCQIGCIAC